MVNLLEGEIGVGELFRDSFEPLD